MYTALVNDPFSCIFDNCYHFHLIIHVFVILHLLNGPRFTGNSFQTTVLYLPNNNK